MKSSLNGKTILLTRPYLSALEDQELAAERQGRSIIVPMIETQAIKSGNEHEIIRKLPLYSWVVLTSRNSAVYTINWFKKQNSEWLKSIKIAVIGEKTANYVKSQGYSIAFCPKSFRAADFIKEFPYDLADEGRVLFPQGNLARPTILNAFQQRAIQCDKWVLYKTIKPEESRRKLVKAFKQNDFSVITFASPSAVRNFVGIVEEDDHLFQALKQGKWIIASIGPTTTEELVKCRLPVHVEPGVYTMEAMIEAIAAHINKEV
ncbi:uroporphyrinogen-III synthase [Jeotgalibacillus sp. ET6]|uniref:uroporphyrinogen-III synthase n=1 Tax=Jeotgalibacillus sp. ET6 TaxID=3037260 RepID=UPI0024186429|nr:uroporphyrinogen-III synthase [Jeotgalibacillus sp. ET6]MDG5470978.1 uroporphyrinogen-III synthase [Jeotgalibacillus sp. ET6]